VNLSDHRFTVVEGNIRFGLDAVKGVGFQAVEAIKRSHDEGGPFASLWDFCERVDCRAVNKKAIEALIKCGAFGSTGASRKGMLMVLEQAQGAGQKAQQDALIGQGSIFDLGDLGGAGAGSPSTAMPSHVPIEMIVFGKPLLACEEALAPDAIVLVRGRVDHKDREKTCLIVQQVDRFEPTPEEVLDAQERADAPPVAPEALRLRLDASALPASVLGELRDLLSGCPGESEV